MGLGLVLVRLLCVVFCWVGVALFVVGSSCVLLVVVVVFLLCWSPSPSPMAPLQTRSTPQVCCMGVTSLARAVMH